MLVARCLETLPHGRGSAWSVRYDFETHLHYY